MTLYLLDTNIVSNLMRAPHGPAMRRFEEIGEDLAYLSIVVAGELRFGAAKKRSVRLMREVEETVGRMTVVPLGPPVEAKYADLRAKLEAAGIADEFTGDSRIVSMHPDAEAGMHEPTLREWADACGRGDDLLAFEQEVRNGRQVRGICMFLAQPWQSLCMHLRSWRLQKFRAHL